MKNAAPSSRSRGPSLTGGLIAGVVTAALLVAGCGSGGSSSTHPASTSAAANTSAASGAACPHSPVRFAVEPYDAGPALEAAYKSLASDLQAKLGCSVQLIISDSYVAEIEAMRTDISALIGAGFGCTPTGCHGVNSKFAGSHTATLLALTHGTVDAAEINSQQQASATAAKQFNAADYRQIWKSTPIINDPITVRGDLLPAFQARVKAAFLSLSAAQTSTVDKELGTASNGPMVAASDGLYNHVRAVATAVHLTTSDLG